MDTLTITTSTIAIGITGALLSIIASILFILKKQSRKAISYEIISSTSLLNLKDMIAGKAQVLYKNKPITDTYLVVLRIWNSGNVPILANDFMHPIQIDFGNGTEILEVEISETMPTTLSNRISFTTNREKLEISPTLFNAKDFIKLRVLLSHYEGKLEVVGRVVGIPNITAQSY